MDRRRLLEWGKTLLIVLLAVSAARLSMAAGLFSFPLDGSGIASTGEDNLSVSYRRELAARPLTMMITATENAHHGIKYSSEALSEVYSWFSASLGEALGSSGEPAEVTPEKWREALHGPGVFFDYLYEQSLSAIAGWLGVDISSEVSLHTSRRFCLAVENERVYLYYIRDLDGKAYRCETALNSGRLLERMAGYVPNGALFAFEGGEEYELIDPYYCILPELAAVPVLTASNPLQGEDGSSLLSQFGMNPMVATRYPESDGTQVYVEGDQTLRLYSDGRVLYSLLRSEEKDERTVSTSWAINRAFALAMSMPGAEDRTLQMSAISYDQDEDEYTVRFEYTVNAMVVCYGGRAGAMEIILDGSGELCRADLMCRSYTTQSSELPMPEEQALAVVEVLGGGEPMLCYADNGESVENAWVIKR
ncbi:MAG: hypothetical protein ACOX81_10695 [Candidatus Heteroscillospira sp.]|jgi:hypothetical protein